MKILQEKSECCNAKIIRFGGKRRQCVACAKTWRVHPAKRGRKAKRRQTIYLTHVLNHGLAVKHLALHSRLSTGAIYKRFAKNLESKLKQKRYLRFRGKKLILIIDAEWQYFRGRLWTIYLLAIKSVGTQSVTIADPLLKQGKENVADWEKIVDTLPIVVRKRIYAMVSDGIRGIEGLAARHCWILQRCHFHLLSTLQKMRGKRATTIGRLTREKIYSLTRAAINEIDERRFCIICRQLARLAERDECPKKMRMTVREFLRHRADFRSYLNYPKLLLPKTTNVMESVNSFIRRRARTANTPKSWHKWAIAAIRFKSKFACK